MLTKICRLCGSEKLELILQIVNMPRWNHRLLQAHELSTDTGIDLQAYRCSSCGFVNVPANLAGDYYDDYVNVPSQSLQAQTFQKEQASQFVNRFGLVGRSILEVGCGDGFFLRSMQDAGAKCIGIEPSRVQREIANARGLHVEEGILASGRILSHAPFDAFVTRRVFEHVEDMRDFLLTIRGNLNLGAVGLVEVPNLDKLVEGGRFFDFIPEHINYFSPRTLRLILEMAGFEPIEISPVDNGESLRALVRWEVLPDFHAISSRVTSLRVEFDSFLADCRARGKRVAIWGAGGKGLSIMAIADLSRVDLLVDGDPGKVGRYTPVSHLQVAPSEEINRLNIDAVIITAPAYQNEIARRLRTEFGFTGTIVLAGSGFQIFEEVNAAGEEGVPVPLPGDSLSVVRNLACAIRSDVLKMVHRANASHVGSCFSIVDILAVLYGQVMCVKPGAPRHPERDRFILSKGHAAAAVYATLANVGIIPRADLDTYGADGSPYMTHISHKITGVEFSSGSLGHGLPFGVGKALAAKKRGYAWRVFVVLSDGEMDEGSNWEAMMFASHHRLDNLVAIIDYNKLQSLTAVSQTLGLEPLVDKLTAFGWTVREADGHDHAQLVNHLSAAPWIAGQPSLLVAHTTKGKGVSFMENKVEWHYRSPNSEQLDVALAELGADNRA